ncbi:MAG: phosphoribosylformylglycinamidine synthase subunit PurS [Methanoculleaceae archaeon]
MRFITEITISLKEGMLDPEAGAIQKALVNLGFPVRSLRTARVFTVEIDASDATAAEEEARQMCERLLANPVIHDYRIEVIR